MTPDQLKELERLNERWANPDNFKNDTAISHAVMDLLPDMLAHVKQLTAERDAAIQGMMNETTRVNSFINDTIVLRQERDAALKACEAYRERINDAFASAWTNDDVEDGHYYVAASIMLDLKQLALSADCGKGYHAVSEWKPVVDALRWCADHCGGYDREQAKQALAHAEKLMEEKP